MQVRVRDAYAAGVAATKFRVPRVRPDALERASLVGRLRASVLAYPVTAVVAPAGFGKTTALAQLAASLPEVPLAWVSLDEDDDDPNRLYAHLVRALDPLGLDYEEEPAALIAAVGAGGRQARAAVGALVNALCTSPAERIVLILDDLHRAGHPDNAALLEAFVERLPDHVALVLAGRSLPDVPLARWVVRGEAAEFGPESLCLDATEATALARARLGDDARTVPVDALLERTRGWAAGLAMLLRAPSRGAAAADGDEHLFEYLAAEVLDGLPAELRRFALDVAVLGELAPEPCAAVSGRDDAAALLRALVDRDLFVVVLDARRPLLRFHDLFRDFLLAELQREPGRLRDLHARAARAEPAYARSIHHWIAAGDWHAALARLLDAADALLAEGGHAAVERWLDRFPPHVAERAFAWQYLRGICAWRRWDWFRSRDALQRAAALFDDATPPRLRARTLLYLMGARHGLGDRGGAAAAGDAARSLALEDAERTALALQDAWRDMGRGDCAGAVANLHAAARLVAGDPSIAPSAADRAHTIYIGLPGALDAYRDLLRAYAVAPGAALAPWHGARAEIEGWTALWQGDRARTEAAIATAQDVIRHFGDIPPLQDGLARLRAVHLAVTGRGAEAVAIASRLVARFESTQGESAHAESLRVAFESAYVHGCARVAWAAADHDAFRALAPRASRPPRPEEWAFVALAARSIPAQLALLDGDWAAAAATFEPLVPLHARTRCPMGQVDPRLGLAHALLRQGRRDAALGALEPVLAECRREHAIGALLLEPDWLVAPLLAALPAGRRDEPALAALLRSLADWREHAAAARSAGRAAPAASGPLALLTDREREVLDRVADGASNKEIARDLDLSLHTVKRHIANILGKLDCVSRRQATELVRRARA